MILQNRENDDLFAKMKLSLSDALCGLRRVIMTLDKRELVVQTRPGWCDFFEIGFLLKLSL